MLSSLFKKPWLMLLMIFIMSWAGVSNAVSLPQHQLLKFHKLTQQTHALHHPMGCEQHTTMQAVQLKSTTPCHAHHSDSADKSFQHETFQHESLQHESSANLKPLLSHQSDCHDCHVFHCQMASSGLLPAVPALPINIADVYVENLLMSYAQQHLTGHWQRILRPPKA